MRIDFPYRGYETIGPVEAPDANLMGVYSPRAFDRVDQEAVLRRGFAAPIGAPRLRDAVGRARRVLILIDDASRMTPTARILPSVLDELKAADISGGAKIAFPGVSGREMMERCQWEASLHRAETVMGVPENPMRLRIEEAARMAGLRYIVNVVYDINGRIVGCFSGDVVAAHREGSKCACRVYAAHLPTRAEVVLIDSHPADRDFWQSAKGPYAGTIAVKDGGSLILVSPNPEGVASNHTNLLEIGYRPHAELIRMAQRGEVDHLIGLSILADVCQIVEKTDCIMVSPGVTRVDAERLGFRSAPAVQEALRLALQRQGPTAAVAVLRYGGHILPIVDDEAAGRLAAWADGGERT